MLKRILFLSTKYTGNGHKSISDALNEDFMKYSSQLEVHTVEAFELGGPIVKLMGKAYSFVATHSRVTWKLCYSFCQNFPSYMNSFGVLTINKNLLSIIENVKPDLIITNHPGLVGCVLDILQKASIETPVIVMVADISSLSRLWADNRALYTICPTLESKEKIIEYGVYENKTKVLGFPVRKCFSGQHTDISGEREPLKQRVLMIGGSTKHHKVFGIIRQIIHNTNYELTVICGRDRILLKKLTEKLLPKYNDRLTVLGFTKDIVSHMSRSSVLLTKAGPNIIMEAVNCRLPVVSIDAIPGQEAENPSFLLKNNLGVVCNKSREIPGVLHMLFENDGEMLKKIRQSQSDFIKSNASSTIVDFIVEKVAGE